MIEVMRVPYRSTTRNAHGRDVHSFGAPGPVPGAVFWPEQSVESSDGGQQIVRPARLAVPPEQPTDPRDQWMVDGLTYQAQGDLGQWVNPFTGTHAGGTITLRRVTG